MTDHSQEAKYLLAPDWRDGTAAIAQLLEGQVHATLALVEQQRIANLIAYAAMRWENGDESIVTSRDAVMEIRRQAYEGLGLA